ncbi:MAG: hypothetical protein ABI191_05675 [Rhizomicrobium sp.]
MKKPIGALILWVALASAPSAIAQDAAAPYPDPQCTKPDLIKPPMSNNDTAQVSIYNAKVKLFNRDAKAYNDCVRAYVDKANLDVTRIHDQAGIDQKRLADNANAAMKEVQDKIQRALAESNALIAAQNNMPSR